MGRQEGQHWRNGDFCELPHGVVDQAELSALTREGVSGEAGHQGGTMEPVPTKHLGGTLLGEGG
jgi:hypothetical protein